MHSSAFTVEDATGAPGFATLPVGVKVSSIPVQSQLPQTFETVEAASVRAEWNVLRPRTTAPQTLDGDATEVLLAGVANVLESGDGLLLIDTASAQHWDFRVVRSVESVPSGGYTRVTWTQPLGPLGVAQADAFEVHVFRQRAALFGHNAPDFGPCRIRSRRRMARRMAPSGRISTSRPARRSTLTRSTRASCRTPGRS